MTQHTQDECFIIRNQDSEYVCKTGLSKNIEDAYHFDTHSQANEHNQNYGHEFVVVGVWHA